METNASRFWQRVLRCLLAFLGVAEFRQWYCRHRCPRFSAKRTPVGVPVIAICGSLAEDLPSLPFENIQAAFSILEKSEPLEDSLKKASLYLEHTAANIGHLLKMPKI